MNRYLKVKTDSSLIRDMESNAIVNNNKTEYDKFLRISEIKHKEKMEMQNLKDDVQSLKDDMKDIKDLLLTIAKNHL